MNKADVIREFVLKNFVEPAMLLGKEEIIIRAGDIHKAMQLKDAMPAVVSAIGSNKFLDLARVELISRKGPQNGANLYFTFRLKEEIS